MITGPAIVIAKKSRHPVLEEAAAAEGALCHGARLGRSCRHHEPADLQKLVEAGRAADRAALALRALRQPAHRLGSGLAIRRRPSDDRGSKLATWRSFSRRGFPSAVVSTVARNDVLASAYGLRGNRIVISL